MNDNERKNMIKKEVKEIESSINVKLEKVEESVI
jgi:hypothetical protein